AGHVVVGDHVILSGFAGIHQARRIGDHAFIRTGASVNGDVPPFRMTAQARYGRPRGTNAAGPTRRRVHPGRTAAIRRAYRAVYMSGETLDDARGELAELASGSEDVRLMLDFIEGGERPLLR